MAVQGWLQGILDDGSSSLPGVGPATQSSDNGVWLPKEWQMQDFQARAPKYWIYIEKKKTESLLRKVWIESFYWKNLKILGFCWGKFQNFVIPLKKFLGYYWRIFLLWEQTKLIIGAADRCRELHTLSYPRLPEETGKCLLRGSLPWLGLWTLAITWCYPFSL